MPGTAAAQQHTFQLDRLQVAGAPEDGIALFRPVVSSDAPTFFAQLGLGDAINPLRTANITQNDLIRQNSPNAAINNQFLSYMTAGFEFLNRFTVAATLPVAWQESGTNPNYAGSLGFSAPGSTIFGTSGPAAGDLRLDFRAKIWESEDKKWAFGGQLSVFAPTGNGSATNFGGDGSGGWMPMVSAEYRIPKVITFVANTGFQFRHDNSINSPTDPLSPNTIGGLGVSDEWRWAVGAFLPPLLKQKIRFGATIFGQTGIKSDSTVGNTGFTGRNTPIEWLGEGRMKVSFLPNGYVGASVGSRISDGYGAPDFRIVALLGMSVPLVDTHPKSPPPKPQQRDLSQIDTDHDGIPDDVDACPTVPEDHQDPDPFDGCPKPQDRDNDGIPDSVDKCPDQPEDFDGIDDWDGCPEVDADKDGIPDTEDACPKEPGQRSPDPTKNGCPQFIKLEQGSVRILEQVHFATGSAQILPDSFPMLNEIVQLLNVNPTIKKIRIEGHTDNVGDPGMNLDLSKRRAASVREWIVGHGVAASRLESEGYGLTRPIATNATVDGRQANRRVEFKITEEEHPEDKVEQLMHPGRKKGAKPGNSAPAEEEDEPATTKSRPAPKEEPASAD